MIQTPRQHSQSRRVPIIWVALTLAIGCVFVTSVPVLSWMAVRQHNHDTRHAALRPVITVHNAVPPHEIRRFTVTIENNKVTSGLPITVRHGDRVFIAIAIGEQDEAEFQIPALLQSTTVEHGGVKHFEFTADKRGTHDVIMANEEPWEGETFSHVVGQVHVY